MQINNGIEKIEQGLAQLLQAQPAHFLVEIRVKPTNNIKLFIDSDEGMPLSALIDYNRKLYRWIEEQGLYPDGDFSLEVSSPGLDEPLKLKRQYKKNEGRFIEVLLNDGTKKEGKLIGANDERIIISYERGKGKAKQTVEEEILFTDIKTTKIQIKF